MLRKTRKLVAAIMAATVLLFASTLPGIGAAPADASSGFFNISLSRGDQPGYVVRDGGSTPFSHNGPFYELYGYVSNSVMVHSLQGFEGTVEIEVSNVPAGVTVEPTFPTTIELERGDFLLFPLRITVDGTVALDTDISGITITGTSGAMTSTDEVSTFTVVDPLPCSSYWTPHYCYYFGN